MSNSNFVSQLGQMKDDDQSSFLAMNMLCSLIFFITYLNIIMFFPEYLYLCLGFGAVVNINIIWLVYALNRYDNHMQNVF